ncbi:hypothetical protein GTY80_40350 [Amycolatopsis sp. SID8362]|nr:hypothetical protein [Amycolatopsis sp. SID8362]NED46169.1 hypothetical protein [Amycolatopsis sp. SID8362]
MFGEWPQIGRTLYESRLRFFSAWDGQGSVDRLDDIEWLRRRRLKFAGIAALTALGFLVVVGLITYWSMLPAEATPLVPAQPVDNRYLPFIAAGVAVFFCCGVAVVGYQAVRIGGYGLRFVRGVDVRSRIRFYRSVGAALSAWERRGRPIRVLQLAGAAARALFLVVQTEHWTWASPPALADRAARLARPVLDIEVSDRPTHEEAGAVCRFLIDVAIVVIAGREDLVPEVRRHHGDLRNRPARDSGATDRELLFLDPMRDRTRWEVLKDFVFPLASWLSFAVSVAALFVALSR